MVLTGLTGTFSLLVLTLCGATASAQLISYESFDYADDLDLNSANGNGGSGWADAWQQRGGNGGPERFTAQAGGLSYTDTGGNILAVAGNYGLADFNGFAADDAGGGGNVQMFRQADLGGAANLGELVGVGNSYYLSFIGERRGATNSAAFASEPDYVNPHAPNEYSRNAHLSLINSGDGEDGQIGNPSSQTTDTWKIRAKDGPDADSGVQFSNNQSFVVAKITVGDLVNQTSTDQIEIWVDPILTSEAMAGGPDASHFVLDGGNLFNMDNTGVGAFVGSQSSGRSGGVMALDEIRIGHSWEDVYTRGTGTQRVNTADVGWLVIDNDRPVAEGIGAAIDFACILRSEFGHLAVQVTPAIDRGGRHQLSAEEIRDSGTSTENRIQ